jgi:hypothetical protein
MVVRILTELRNHRSKQLQFQAYDYHPCKCLDVVRVIILPKIYEGVPEYSKPFLPPKA